MGTIVPRRKKDGSFSYRAQILLKRDGAIVHRESKTFETERKAKTWIKARENDLSRPGALYSQDPSKTLAQAIDTYTGSSEAQIKRTKAQVLRSIKDHKIAAMKCEDITSRDLIDFFKELKQGGRSKGTVSNYAAHLSSIFSIAKPAWGMELSVEAMRDATAVARKLGYMGRAKKRHRRPSLEELDKILQHFEQRKKAAPQAMDMIPVILFAIFSTRRLGEICRIRWDGLKGNRILVEDMKHPGQTEENDTWCLLPDRALGILKHVPKKDERIFPYITDATGINFTRACATLGIDDLRFHDLRHEGASWLAELGWTIPQIASVTGHRGWSGLQRYSHFEEAGDKYAGWKWAEEWAPSESDAENIPLP